jgi:hypothetical protein
MTELDGFWPDGALPDGGHRPAQTYFRGTSPRVRVLDRIFTRLREHQDVWWARRDQIAQWVIDHPDTAAWVDRDPAPVSGLPGRSS